MKFELCDRLRPYFISLSLWVGAMLLFTVVDLYRVFPDRGSRFPCRLPP